MSAAVKCDNCGWYAEAQPNVYMDYRILPPGWVELRHSTADENGRVEFFRSSNEPSGGSFCRIECAAAYMAKQVAAERSEASTASESETV